MDETRSVSPHEALKLKVRKRLLLTVHFVACAVALVALVLSAGYADPGGETIRGIPFYPLVIAGALAVVLVLTLMWVKWWRCPECDRYLGQVFALQNCPRCGSQLT